MFLNIIIKKGGRENEKMVILFSFKSFICNSFLYLYFFVYKVCHHHDRTFYVANGNTNTTFIFQFGNLFYCNKK